jgi:hypothetical protein
MTVHVLCSPPDLSAAFHGLAAPAFDGLAAPANRRRRAAQWAQEQPALALERNVKRGAQSEH